MARLAAIDEDIAEMQKRLESASTTGAGQGSISLRELTMPAKRKSLPIEHTPPARFLPGQPFEIVIAVPPSIPKSPAVRLYYRAVNQVEKYQSTDMHTDGKRLSAIIPASYTNSKYPIQYYFELRHAADNAWLFPGLGKDLLNQPYFVVRPASGIRTGARTS